MADLRILHIIHGLTVGGAEVDLLDKSQALSHEYGCEITFCCLMRRGELAIQAELQGFHIVGPLMRHRYDLLAWGSLRRVIQSGSWSLVHSHLFASNFVTAAVYQSLAAKHRPPLVASEHAMAERWSPLDLWIDRRLLQPTAAFIQVPTQAAAQSYIDRGLSPQKLQVLPDAIDIRRFDSVDRPSARSKKRKELDIPEETILVGAICRLEAVKNLPLLVDAVRELPVQLIIAGEGPEHSRLEALIGQYKLGRRVRLLGQRFDIPELLPALDLFVLPSASETFGIAVAEALLMQIPVIATRTGGIPEVTQGDSFACLVAPGDTPALRSAIQAFLDDPTPLRDRARQGSGYVRENLSVENIARRQMETYLRLKDER